MKDVLGFKNGYITIFKGNIEAVEEWFKAEKVCRFHSIWGWYISSEDEIPALPTEVEPVRLEWETITETDGSFKPSTAIATIVEKLIYGPSTSKHFGNIGERLEITLRVVKVIDLNDYYGKKSFHIFLTPDGDVATWTTTTKTLTAGEEYKMRATVSAHEIYKGEAQTRLTRCTIVK